MIKVSVILPNYNHAQYLPKRIESILNQTYQNFELIILDDCSTDNSRELLEVYRNHPKVSNLVFNEKNSGNPFYQWYKGIKLSKGKYIWIAESDDWAEPDFLENLVPVMEQNPSVGLAYSNSIIEINDVVTDDFATVKNKRYQTSHWAEPYLISGADEIRQFLLRDCTVNNASAVLMRRELLLDIFPIHELFRFSGDWYCYLRIAAVADVYYTNKSLNHYREHKSNTSKSAGYNYIKEVFYIYDWILKNDVVKREQAKVTFSLYISDLYSGDNKWHIDKGFKKLSKINGFLYRVFLQKTIKMSIRRFANNLFKSHFF